MSADKEDGDFNIMLEKPKPYRKGTLNMTKVPIIRQKNKYYDFLKQRFEENKLG